MTAEEKRERQLKRILPGLAIIVVYFSFLSRWVTQGEEKAKADIKALQSRGIAVNAMPAMLQQEQQLDADIRRLSAQKAEFGKRLQEQAGFLSDPGYGSQLSDRVSSLLAKHHLRETGDDKLGGKPSGEKEIAPAVRDVAQHMPQAVGKKTSPTVWQVNFTGAYADVYRMLAELQAEKSAVIPVALSMKPAPEDRMGMSWSLSMWTGFQEEAKPKK